MFIINYIIFQNYFYQLQIHNQVNILGMPEITLDPEKKISTQGFSVQ